MNECDKFDDQRIDHAEGLPMTIDELISELRRLHTRYKAYCIECDVAYPCDTIKEIERYENQ
jgi:hypothetical protein